MHDIVLTGADDAEWISRGVYDDAYTRLNLRYSQLAPLTKGNDFFADPAGQTTVPLSGLRVRSAEKV